VGASPPNAAKEVRGTLTTSPGFGTKESQSPQVQPSRTLSRRLRRDVDRWTPFLVSRDGRRTRLTTQPVRRRPLGSHACGAVRLDHLALGSLMPFSTAAVAFFATVELSSYLALPLHGVNFFVEK
jgi:hypothetical protein